MNKNESKKIVDKWVCENMQTIEAKRLASICIKDMPEYIWEIPASSSGKYHPEDDCQEGGLIMHMLKAAEVCNMLTQMEHNRGKISAYDRDLMLIACLVHDGRKSGEENSGHTVHEHPLLEAEALHRIAEERPEYASELDFIASLVSSHMGEWTKSKYSEAVLPKPSTLEQKLVHEADYIVSRKNVRILF